MPLEAQLEASSAGVQPDRPVSVKGSEHSPFDPVRDVVQRTGGLQLVFIQRLGRIFHAARATRERERRGDQRRGDARAADRAPVQHVFHFRFFIAVFTFRARVVDGDPRIGVRVRGDIGDGTFRRRSQPPTSRTRSAARAARRTPHCSHHPSRRRRSRPSRPPTRCPCPRLSRVPPTATTCGEDAGKLA